MIRSVLIGTALAGLTALAATAHDNNRPVTETETKTDYRAQVVDTGAGHQGREYMSNGVRVIEGAPRWTEMRQSSSTRSVSRILDPLIQYFD
jgi:hypothetical protein